MGKVLPLQALVNSFRYRLNTNLLDLISYILYTVKYIGIEITIDNILIDLLEYKRRKEDQEKSGNTSTAKKAGLKAFGRNNNNKNDNQNKGNNNKASGNQNQAQSSRGKSKNRNQNDDEKPEVIYNTPCPGCGSFWHRKDKYYYLNKDLRPNNQKPPINK